MSSKDKAWKMYRTEVAKSDNHLILKQSKELAMLFYLFIYLF